MAGRGLTRPDDHDKDTDMGMDPIELGEGVLGWEPDAPERYESRGTVYLRNDNGACGELPSEHLAELGALEFFDGTLNREDIHGRLIAVDGDGTAVDLGEGTVLVLDSCYLIGLLPDGADHADGYDRARLDEAAVERCIGQWVRLVLAPTD